MRIQRRSGILCGAFALLSLVMAGHSLPAGAQAWPDKPITIVVGSGPGSAPDVIARLIGDQLSKRMGQPVIIDNKPGASGAIGAAAAARAPSDGNTLLMMTAVHTILPSLSKDAPYDAVGSFTPVANVASVPLILVVDKSLGVNSLKELIARARAKPGSLYYASPGNGTLQHFATALLTQREQVNMVHVPYKSGGEAITGLLGGQVQLFFSGMPPALPQMQAGKLVALAVSTEKRSAAAPEVPTLIELGYAGMTADNWHALVAPARTPLERVQRLAKEISEILKDPATRASLVKLGGEADFKDPVALGKVIGGETAKWRTVIPATGLKLN
ncbi:MAG: tripartite tricarboxylate transporter substrate binding protein [Proteobacteria bacterium]|nr:tripartite tricarboxylate transporter substrate binding protein [Pseudomonadota bacterium]